MLTILVALRLCALSQVLLFVAALLVSRAAPSVRGFGAGFGLCTACYLVLPLVATRIDGALGVLPRALTHLVPLFFLLFLHALYEDRPLPRALVSAALAFVALALAVSALAASPFAELALAPLVALQLLKLLCVVAALVVVVRGRDADLIDARRASRSPVAAAIAALMASIVIAELVRGFRVEPALELLGMGAILALAFAVNLAMMRIETWLEPRPRRRGDVAGIVAGADMDAGIDIDTDTGAGVPDASAPADTEPARPDDATAALVSRLRAAMHEERLYADHDLRVATLAAHLGVPEYRLRRLINGTLGHRNFNQFVNGYRLEEAASRLASDPRTPVLTIALDVGFRSISSFNAAFRERFGSSAGAYRRRRQAEIRQ